MPWQQLVADTALEYDADTGRLYYREVNVAVPRQCGKTTLALALMIHRATRFGPRQSITYTAQTRKAAVQKWRETHVPMIEESPFGAHVEVRRSNGSEAILWGNGSIYSLDAPTETSGHGLTLDLALVDEAWSYEDDRQEQALGPAMLTRSSPQLWVMSTAGNDRSAYWYRKILAGRAGCEDESSTAFFEWSAADDADPDDPATWRSCIPSLGHTVEESTIATELERARRGEADGLALFRRAYLNQWPEVPVLDDRRPSVIPLDAWDACLNDTSRIDGDHAFAVDMTPDRSTVAIVVAGRSSTGGLHVEVVEHQRGRGADWIIGRLSELVDRHPTSHVTAHLNGPIGSLEPRLVAAFGDRFRPVTDRELPAACGQLFDVIRDGELVHVGDPAIRAALDGAARSAAGDAWRWSRRNSAVDISPLMAATLAAFVHKLPPAEAPPEVWVMFE